MPLCTIHFCRRLKVSLLLVYALKASSHRLHPNPQYSAGAQCFKVELSVLFPSKHYLLTKFRLCAGLFTFDPTAVSGVSSSWF